MIFQEDKIELKLMNNMFKLFRQHKLIDAETSDKFIMPTVESFQYYVQILLELFIY